MTYDSNERKLALELATRDLGNSSEANVLGRARAYLDFLNGDDRAKMSDVAETEQTKSARPEGGYMCRGEDMPRMEAILRAVDAINVLDSFGQKDSTK
jgi:hypothetical protein